MVRSESDARILNLGSGQRPIKEALNLDMNPLNPGVNCVHNLENPLPFADSQFDVVIAYHILEHILNVVPLLNEIHRVCKPNGVVKIEAPHYTNPQFYDDPTHLRPFSEMTLPFICNDGNTSALGLKGKFKMRLNMVIGEPWSREKPTVLVGELEVIK